MYFCNDCKKFFEQPREETVYEIPNINIDTNKYEKHIEERCPNCDGDYLSKADACLICKEPIEPDTELCEDCAKEIQWTLERFASLQFVSYMDACDGFSSFLSRG